MTKRYGEYGTVPTQQNFVELKRAIESHQNFIAKRAVPWVRIILELLTIILLSLLVLK